MTITIDFGEAVQVGRTDILSDLGVDDFYIKFWRLNEDDELEEVSDGRVRCMTLDHRCLISNIQQLLKQTVGFLSVI